MRNVCAHHARLWNRVLGTVPLIPLERKHPEWHRPYRLDVGRVFAALTICTYCLGVISARSDWPARARALIDEQPRLYHRSMGIPDRCWESPLWRAALEAGGG